MFLSRYNKDISESLNLQWNWSISTGAVTPIIRLFLKIDRNDRPMMRWCDD